MIPSIDDRLDSVMRALQEVILPALAPEQSLAIEQAHLSLAQLGLVRAQLDRAPAFEREEAQAMLDLARQLAHVAAGGAATMAGAAHLEAAAKSATLDSPEAVRRATFEVGVAIEALLEASLDDGSQAFRAASFRCVLEAGRASALANRRWSGAAGFEAPDSGIGPSESG